eukprot:15052800-Alexandrium_andersonii.AAC.1
MTAEALVLNHCLRNSAVLSSLPSMAIDSLMFRTHALRSQASIARCSPPHQGSISRACCSVVLGMPPRGRGRSP